MSYDAPPRDQAGLGRDFWIFWSGQTISNLGTAFTTFGLPLLIFKLTGSALSLGLGMAVTFLPYLLFGLLIGALIDRVNRKRLMVAMDLTRALAIGTLPLMMSVEQLSVPWIYAVMFIVGTCSICFVIAQVSSVPSLVGRPELLLKANGLMQASASGAMVLGPLLAGALINVVDISLLLLVDALTFIASLISLLLVRARLTPRAAQAATSVRADILEGLRYVAGHPVLRTIAIFTAVLNALCTTLNAQLVLFAKQRFEASDSQVSLLLTAGGIGVFVLSLSAGRLRKRWEFSQVAVACIFILGLSIVALGMVPWYPLALPLWALREGLPMLFTIYTLSLRQAIVPRHMLGRVMTIAAVAAYGAVPIGTLLGGLAIELTGQVGLVYSAIGLLICCVAAAATVSPLARAERYMTPEVAA